MATATTYFNFTGGTECLCTCSYMKGDYNPIPISGERVPIEIETSNFTHKFRFYPVSGASFEKDGAVIDESKVYYQSYSVLMEEYSDPVYATGAAAVLVGGDYVELSITRDCNLYDIIKTGGYYITFDKEFIKAVANVMKIAGSLVNCTCNYADGEVITDEKPDLVITANEGFEFIGTNYHFIAGRYAEEIEMENYQNRLLYQNGDYPLASYGSDIVLDMEYIAYSKPEKLAAFVNLYTPTNDELTALAKKRFDSDMNSNVVDMGQYISALYVMPFPIPEDLLSGEKHSIVLGNVTTQVQSSMLMNYYFHIDFGTIIVPEKYHNVYDFLNTQCILHLPYMDSVYINAEYVIGQEITIDYVVDLYSGACTVNIFSSFINDIVESVKGNIYVTIPFIQGISNGVVGTLSGMYQHNKDYAYMEVVRNIPYDVKTPFGKLTKDYGKIGDYTGYIKASEIKLESKATVDEKNSIENLLKNGVFIVSKNS